MTTEQLLEKLRKSGLEEVDNFSNKCMFKINNDKFIEIQEPSLDRIPTRLSVIFWHSAESFIPKQKKDTIWGRLKIWGVYTPDEFEEHFTRFLNE
jgi:hypothetical protein